MRKTLVLFLLFFFCLYELPAGVGSQKAKCVGTTTNTPPIDASGFMDVRDESRLSFNYKAGKNGEIGKYSAASFDVPYAAMTKLIYGQEKHLRVGQTLALTALAGAGGLLLLLSKSHSHYLTVEYTDAQDKKQMASFEIGKEAIQPLLKSLEMHTGEKIEYETETTSKTPAKN